VLLALVAIGIACFGGLLLRLGTEGEALSLATRRRKNPPEARP
jgi:hypothetical protein